MWKLLKLAWLNLWRNKRRTLLAMSSVAFALVVTISLRSLQLGSYGRMIEAAVKNIGNLQIHLTGYWKDKSINDLMEQDSLIEEQIRSLDGVVAVLPRLTNYVLAAGEVKSKAALLVGFDPVKENQFNKLESRIIAGTYLNTTDSDIMLTEGLARYLNVALNDSVVLLSQGYQGNFATGKYRVKGIVKLINPKLNLLMVYMPLALSQNFHSAPDMVSAYLIDMPKATDQNASQLAKELGDSFEIMLWHEISPDILNTLKIDTVLFMLISTALFVIVGFGIIGTVMMMALERLKEFAILNAIGMQKIKIQKLLLIESFLMGIGGIVLGLLIEIPFALIMHHNPIPLVGDAAKPFEAMGAEPFLLMAIKPHLFGIMIGIVMLIMFLATLYPAYRIGKLEMDNSIN